MFAFCYYSIGREVNIKKKIKCKAHELKYKTYICLYVSFTCWVNLQRNWIRQLDWYQERLKRHWLYQS